MEMKPYQKKVIAALARYLELLNKTRNSAAAFRQFWQERSAPSLGRYQDILPGVPNLCIKVPTGGGKTFIACNAVRPIFDALPMTKAKVVVWLVPSDAILTQTIKALKDTQHPYRQKIDVDFGGRVEVYTKQELLSGQNFNPTAVTEQLSIMVLSYDSFRGRGKEVLKAYQENSNLVSFAKALGKPENPIENADETALFQIINQLSPLVIVDESHHARSELSIEMLANFNPCFVLDLTATPRKESNIIAYVDAVQLKQENMVKLPVVVYNRDKTTDVLFDAIDLRNRLEEIAAAEEEKSKRYIRPIVLFQAQPRGKEDATTFEKLRDKLINAGIPGEQIAIRTADVNELKNIDLMAPGCPVRYIITVNALKEGWDCPFAYILASLANKTSQVDVEQILGRILRQPHTTRYSQRALNTSYVLTCSNDFDETVRRIIRGLNSAGFSEKDYRLSGPAAPGPAPLPPEQLGIPTAETPADAGEDVADGLDSEAIRCEFERRRVQQAAPGTPTRADTMLGQADQACQAHEEELADLADDPYAMTLSREERKNVKTIPVNPLFREDIESIMIPQFFQKVPASLFSDGVFELLEKEQLADGFTLKGKAYDIDFDAADDEIAEVDVREEGGNLPRVFKMSSEDQQLFKAYFNSLPQEDRVRQCKDMMFNRLNKMNTVDAAELRSYIELIVGGMGKDQLAAMEKAPYGYAEKIKKKIDTLLEQHYKDTFLRWLETGRIVCQPAYKLPAYIHPNENTAVFGGSLYQAEEEMDSSFERRFAMELTALPNIRWWHRNIARHGFRINGFINHYPDFILMTKSGNIVLAEPKGQHLKNDGSQNRLTLGNAWRSAAGSQYRYYMVFADDVEPISGAVTLQSFKEIVKEL